MHTHDAHIILARQHQPTNQPLDPRATGPIVSPPLFPTPLPRFCQLKQQVAQTLDLGDGKTQKIFERIKVEPTPEHRPPIKLSGPVGKITRCVPGLGFGLGC